MKIEKDMYVRTKYGISKVIKFEKVNTFDLVALDNKKGSCFWNGYQGVYKKDIIGKPSFDIIDLIEESDYVNGEKVGYIDDCEGSMRQYHYDYEEPNEDVGHWNEEIKTIVTHEQFESMSYKIGE